jgi:hypothetical protein
MLIAIDFDQTLDRDPILWRVFIAHAIQRDHSVIVVTARRNTDENRDILRDWLDDNGFDLPFYFTNLKSKVDEMERRGFDVDIWIDDSPRTCALGY